MTGTDFLAIYGALLATGLAVWTSRRDRRDRSPDGMQWNPGNGRRRVPVPDSASLHPGYNLYDAADPAAGSGGRQKPPRPTFG